MKFWRDGALVACLIPLAACYFGGGGGGGDDGSGEGSADASDAGLDAHDGGEADGSDEPGDAHATDAADTADTDVTDVLDELPPCTLACGEHGRCALVDLVEQCICDVGYAGATCADCEADYQDNDGDGDCLPACDGALAPDCVNGSCRDDAGAATCACDPGFAGETCAECGRGLVAEGSGCIFGDWPEDQELVDPDAWEILGGARFEPDATTEFYAEPGAVFFDGSEVCDVTMGLRTTIPFADVDWSTGYAIHAQSFCLPNDGYPCDSPTADLWVNGVLLSYGGEDPIQADGAWWSTGCLPPHLAGSDLELVIASTAGAGRCSVDTFGLASVKIVRSEMCPNTVGLTDGGFDGELAAAGWSTLGEVSIAGEDRALELLGDVCTIAIASIQVGLPDLESPAISFDVESQSAGLQVSLNHEWWKFFDLSGRLTLCVNRSAAEPDLAMQLRILGPNEDDECIEPAIGRVRVDNVRLHDDPRCSSATGVVGGEFNDASQSVWIRSPRFFGAEIDREIVEGTPSEWFGRIGTHDRCAVGGVRTWAVIPPGIENPALRFDYRYNESLLRAVVRTGARSTQVVPSEGWRSREICISPAWPYSPMFLEFAFDAEQPCALPNFERPASFSFDNIEIIESERCR